MIDFSGLSNEDLKAIAAGNMRAVSDDGLRRIAPNEDQSISNLPGNMAASLVTRLMPQGMRDVFRQAQNEIGLERGAAQAIGQSGRTVTDAIQQAEQYDPMTRGLNAVGIPTIPVASSAARMILPQDELGAQALLAGPLFGAIAEGLGAGARAMKPVASGLMQGAQAMLRYAESKGIPLTAADISGSKTIASIENFLEKTPFGSGQFQEFRNRGIAAIRDLRDKLAEKFGTSEEAGNLGAIAQNAIATNSRARAAAGDALYDRVGELAQDKVIPQPRSANAAIALLEQELRLDPEVRNQGIVDLASKVLRIDPAAITPDTLPFIKEHAAEFSTDFFNWRGTRRLLGDIIEANDAARSLATPGVKFMSSAEAGAARELFKQGKIDLAIFSAKEGGELKKAHDIATAFNKESRGIFNQPTIRRILKTEEPGRIVQIAFRPDSPEAVRAVKAAAGDSGFQALRRTFVEEKLIPEVGDKFSPEGFQNVLDKYQAILPDVFTQNELMQFKGLARAASLVQKADALAATQGSARSNVNIASHVLSSVAGVGGYLLHGPIGAITGTSAVVIGQKGLAALYLSDAGRRLLLDGIRLPATSPQGRKTAAAIFGYLGMKSALENNQ